VDGDGGEARADATGVPVMRPHLQEWVDRGW
jgi:hypothetical protein